MGDNNRPIVGPEPVDTHNYESRWYSPEKAKSYALSGKIMLSAIVILFFVILLMAGLHLYARWYLLRARRRHLRRRRSHLVFYVEPSAPAASRGLDAAVLKSIPVFSYSPSAAGASALECAVCLSEFEAGESGRRLPKCGHSFHTDCIDMWFHSHATCPICRAPVEAHPPAENPPRLPEVSITVPELWSRSEPGSSSTVGAVEETPTSSMKTMPLVERRKEMAGVSIEVPRRNAAEALGLASPSPGGRMRSLKRILSREIRAALSPSAVAAPSSSAASCSSVSHEVDLERAPTPR